MAKIAGVKKNSSKKLAISKPLDDDIYSDKLVEILNTKESWNEYELADGSKLRIKPLVMEVRKSPKKDENGNQQYHIRSSIAIDVQQPPKSKK